MVIFLRQDVGPDLLRKRDTRFLRYLERATGFEPATSAWESNPGVLVYQQFSIFPKNFAIACLAVIAFFLPSCTLWWDICGTSSSVDKTPKNDFYVVVQQGEGI